MKLKERINEDIKTAMKAKDEAALRALRAIKSAILYVETSEGRTPGELTEAEEVQLLQKQIKQRKESIESYEKNGRPELAIPEKEEISVIEKYLPKALTTEELEQIIQEVIAAEGATSAKDMGKVIKAVQAKVAGRAEGKLISERVKALLPA
jgi:uncharacterized protein YqeY